MIGKVILINMKIGKPINNLVADTIRLSSPSNSICNNTHSLLHDAITNDLWSNIIRIIGTHVRVSIVQTNLI